MKELPVVLADDWSEEQQREFVVKDNLPYGSWDWEMLETEWDADELIEWGLEMPEGDEPFEDENKRQIKKENIKPFKKTHILLSFPPEKMLQIQEYIQSIIEIEGVEYEQSSN